MGEGRQEQHKSERDNNRISWRIMVRPLPFQVDSTAVTQPPVTGAKHWIAHFTANIPSQAFNGEKEIWWQMFL